ILTQLLWEESLGQTRHEGDAKGAASDLIGAANEYPPVPMRWWLHFQGCQPVGKHVAHFGQTHRSHRGHGTEIGKHAEHELGAPEHLRCQYFETLEPAAPIVFVGPGGHCFDQRQGKGAEMSKILPLTLQARNTGGVSLLQGKLAKL